MWRFAFDGFKVTLAFMFFSSWSCFSFLIHSKAKLKMDYLTDPASIMPILVVTFHFLTAAGFWIYFCQQMFSFEKGKLFFVTNGWLWEYAIVQFCSSLLD